MEHLSNERMNELMQMEDDAAVGMVQIDQLETFRTDGQTALAWDVEAWYGSDYDKAWFKTEGERRDGESVGRAELLWDHIVSAWWRAQAGVRHDFFEAAPRTWGAIGLQGLAPSFMETTVTMYLGDEGRAAARLSAERDWLLTQRLILQPQFELNAYLEEDRENAIGSGIADIELGLRLRYELIREFAPYVGVQWEHKFGSTADFARAESRDVSDVLFVAGVRAWF
jgi:copper resistance protein B